LAKNYPDEKLRDVLEELQVPLEITYGM